MVTGALRFSKRLFCLPLEPLCFFAAEEFSKKTEECGTAIVAVVSSGVAIQAGHRPVRTNRPHWNRCSGLGEGTGRRVGQHVRLSIADPLIRSKWFEYPVSVGLSPVAAL
jgi:hypothetical protein